MWLRSTIGFAFAALFLSEAAAAPPIPPSEEPGRQQQRFIEPPAAKATTAGSSISLPSTGIPAGAASIMLVIKDIQVVGATVYPLAELEPLYAGLVGHKVTLAAVYNLAQQITAKYGKDGYVLSRAVVPPQSLDPKGATVTIRVIEGYVDQVEWPASLGRDYSDPGQSLQTFQYQIAQTITRWVQAKYPNVILTGHSLGGGLAAYSAATLGLSAVTFNAAAPHFETADEVTKEDEFGILNFEFAGELAGDLDRAAGQNLVGTTVVIDNSLAAPWGRR